jgi:hypothetical protein
MRDVPQIQWHLKFSGESIGNVNHRIQTVNLNHDDSPVPARGVNWRPWQNALWTDALRLNGVVFRRVRAESPAQRSRPE